MNLTMIDKIDLKNIRVRIARRVTQFDERNESP